MNRIAAKALIKAPLGALAMAAAALMVAVPASNAASGSGPAPQFTLDSRAGSKISLSQYKGQVVMLNFWASWCGPCRQEIPLLNRASRRSTGKVAFVGIAVDEAADAKRFLRQVPTAYPVYLAAQELPTVLLSQGDLFGLLPYTVFYDRNGQRVGSQTGALDPKQLEAMLRRLNG
jgi:thiol-disulfide isomerase/thioredoxin